MVQKCKKSGLRSLVRKNQKGGKFKRNSRSEITGLGEQRRRKVKRRWPRKRDNGLKKIRKRITRIKSGRVEKEEKDGCGRERGKGKAKRTPDQYCQMEKAQRKKFTGGPAISQTAPKRGDGGERSTGGN